MNNKTLEKQAWLKDYKKGNLFSAQSRFGAHFCQFDGKNGVMFRVYAKRALAVSLLLYSSSNPTKRGKITKFPMSQTACGVFERFVEGIGEGVRYQYEITTKSGKRLIKSDPYAFFADLSKKDGLRASKTYDLSSYAWQDGEYLESVRHKDSFSRPIHIYEVNLLSWKRRKNGGYYNYLEIAKELIPYVKKMGYTHVELMPLCEFPFDGSWGYQTTGYFAITSRLGSPRDFKRFVDLFHAENVGVLLDWVPAHFPKDDFGLAFFDGQPFFEPYPKWIREHKGWGTHLFDFSKGEVNSFLISSALFLLKEYHLDGLRVDAVASILYLDYDKGQGEWKPNKKGGNVNLDGVSFLKKLCFAVKKEVPHALMIAEDSSTFPYLTKPCEEGGVGFDYKWNLGWMNDTLSYFREDPIYRSYHHNNLTFTMTYAFSERFILPISHDEVAQGKGSLWDKMPGNNEDKFANVRAFLGFKMAHPGKKLHFMGEEIGQLTEWDYRKAVPFSLLKEKNHRKLHRYVAALNRFYLQNKPLYEIEDSWDGFNWLEADDQNRNVLAFARKDRSQNTLVALFNFSGCDWKGYRLAVEEGEYAVVFYSDDKRYGGTGALTRRRYKTKNMTRNPKESVLTIDIPRLTCVYLIKIH